VTGSGQAGTWWAWQSGGLAGLWGEDLAEQWLRRPVVQGPGGVGAWQACRAGAQKSGDPAGLQSGGLVALRGQGQRSGDLAGLQSGGSAGLWGGGLMGSGQLFF
jgi:hypothetical protein